MVPQPGQWWRAPSQEVPWDEGGACNPPAQRFNRLRASQATAQWRCAACGMKHSDMTATTCDWCQQGRTSGKGKGEKGKATKGKKNGKGKGGTKSVIDPRQP
eukprot:14949435-Alexandrium_andersonii.AAC.1